MGIYLGQLPPAEMARLKAELAETIISNFCYPRFFDHRTNSLRMRPVDRTKRQEVWLYLSSVDFTAWNRVDVMSPDLQRYVERLFIQFVQRNRNFFGQQGRKRMPDVRTLISTSSASVVQGLRNHVSGQRKEQQPAFGSPRPVISWSTVGGGSRVELSWEQVSTMTLLLQQQLQDIRGESKPASAQDIRPSRSSDADVLPTKRNGRGTTVPSGQQVPKVGTSQGIDRSNPSQVGQPNRGTAPSQPQHVHPHVAPIAPAAPVSPLSPAATVSSPTAPNGIAKKQDAVIQAATFSTATNDKLSLATQNTQTTPTAPSPSVVMDVRTQVAPKQGNGVIPPPTPTTPPAVAIPSVSSQTPQTPQATLLSSPVSPQATIANTPTQSMPPVQVQTPQSVQARIIAQPVQVAPSSPSSPPAPSVSPVSPVSLTDAMVEPREGRDMQMMLVGDEDIVIFEQLRHQMILWLRVEAVHAGVEMTGQGPAQLLDQLRRQERFDETRLQVVSTLLNLANQVIKNKRVSVLDYKQALMFHLMHTRR
ncbi:MAG TPA: hypothetical protein DHW02_16745 [Ktedonobacter sp.]|nr:hypothetical protein [Ktedonobacter sp.]